MRLKLASRKSDLARWQAAMVGKALQTLPQNPQIEFIFKASLGDQDLQTPLASMGSKGVFTEDFHQDLLTGACDLVVHSWKDLPVDERAATRIAMTLPRADVRDLLLVPVAAWRSAEELGVLRVLTSSPRRMYNLGSALVSLLPKAVRLEFVDVRGNVPTRLKKMHQQNAALILAKAGLDRLLSAEQAGFICAEESVRQSLTNCRFMVLPVSINPGAPAQGALAVEILRTAPSDFAEMCTRLNDAETYRCVQRERQILSRYGGGCQQKIGVSILPREYGQLLSLRGLTDRGEVLQQWTIESSTPWPQAVGADQVFPLKPAENNWFQRVPKAVNHDFAQCPALLVARADAWPQGFKAAAQQMVWTAGLQTWQKLAKQGTWVHGTCDGLGEDEAPDIESLAGPLTWTKLTHEQGAQGQAREMVATYALRPLANAPDLRGKTHFFWLSSSSFERARQLFPQVIEQGYNSAGPGHTFDVLRRTPGLQHPPKVFSGWAQFMRETLPSEA
jgi:hydroxymethylbilane synthase